MDTKRSCVRRNTRCVLEQCDFIWIQNSGWCDMCVAAVLEQCDFIWIQNEEDLQLRERCVLEQCDFIWIQNAFQNTEKSPMF